MYYQGGSDSNNETVCDAANPKADWSVQNNRGIAGGGSVNESGQSVSAELQEDTKEQRVH